jgi:hypothetical protein
VVKILAVQDSLFLQMTGIKESAQQVVFIKKALYWECRAWKHRTTNDLGNWRPVQRVYGHLYSLNKDGSLNYQYYEKNRIKYGIGQIANVQITNLLGLARNLLRDKQQPFIFDLYNNGYIVVWRPDGSQVWNLEIIQSGFANPELNPPTGVVDRLFADYYWLKVRQ